MAQIVLIAEGTVREGLNQIGDVVAIHDDNVSLTGPGYTNFKIIHIDGISAEEVQVQIQKLVPEIKHAFKTITKPGEWSFERPEETEVWNDNGSWKKIEERPKYTVNLANIDDTDLAILNDKEASIGLKIVTLSTKGDHNFAVKTVNETILAELTIATAEEAING